MKTLLLFIFLSTKAFSAVFIEVKYKDQTTTSGELIEIYQDRWFYEAPAIRPDKYLLLFNLKNKEPKFHFKSFNQIKSIKLLGKRDSIYKPYLKKHDLFFKNKLVHHAHVLTGNEGHHKYERMFGNFAWDIGIVDHHGSQHSGNPYELDSYYIFGKPIYSPLRGRVVGAVKSQEDNPASPNFDYDLSDKINNYLTIHLHKMFYLSIVHFKKDTITVNIGDKVEVNQFLGLVGNSGISYLPHLHYTMYIYVKEYDRFISVPGYFTNQENTSQLLNDAVEIL